MVYEFVGKLIPTDWLSALLVVIFFIIFQRFRIGSPWTRLVISILAAVAIKGLLISMGML